MLKFIVDTNPIAPVSALLLFKIVGLTASIGVEKAADLEAASANIMKICGNLDAEHLVIVKKNIDELREIVPRPVECKAFLYFKKKFLMLELATILWLC